MRVFVCAVLLTLPGTTADADADPDPARARPTGTIAFASLAPRGWDLVALDVATGRTRRLTDHPALDFNAAFSPDGRRLAFVSERDGNGELYLLDADGGTSPVRLTDAFALDDHPAWSPDGAHIVFSSTREPAEEPGRAWNALYIMDADGGNVRRITAPGLAAYSPAWSPQGDWIACAAGSGEAGKTDLYILRPDGSDWQRLIEDGGWPAFSADGRTFYFHSRRGEDWGIWSVGLDGSGLARVTPPDVTAYTPKVAADGRWLVAAVERSGRRQIARIDLESGELAVLTSDATDHWNPAIAPDGQTVVYHRAASDQDAPNVEPCGTPPRTDLRMLRLDGAFPAFSPDGRRLALVGGGFGRLDVMNLDGSDRRTLYDAGRSRSVFSTSWSRAGDGRIAFAVGGVFQGPSADVDLLTIRPDGSDVQTIAAPGNDGFPAYSPRRVADRLSLGPRRVEEPLHHGRRWHQRPPADRRRLDRLDGRLVARRPLDRLRQ